MFPIICHSWRRDGKILGFITQTGFRLSVPSQGVIYALMHKRSRSNFVYEAEMKNKKAEVWKRSHQRWRKITILRKKSDVAACSDL